MVRNVIGSILALAGATAAVWSPFRAWYDGRHGSDYRIEDLFGGITDAKADLIGSILLPFAFAALVTLAGVVFRSRLLVAFAGLTVLGFTILWMVRVSQVEGGLTVADDGTGLGDGVANALGGGVLLLLASVVMSGRTRRHSIPVGGPRHARSAEPAYPAQPTGPTEPMPPDGGVPQGPYDDPYGSPTRTMDLPAWDPDRDRPDREQPPNHRA
ncbi:proline-rich domain-containing protein [Streptomyces sp. NPDC046324]|uniref:proline-rich domain-containing protein n=1 Tax=Streptomyces sp. NPDC046324 TaxID=3154915 RepID=UPI0033D03E9A